MGWISLKSQMCIDKECGDELDYFDDRMLVSHVGRCDCCRSENDTKR